MTDPGAPAPGIFEEGQMPKASPQEVIDLGFSHEMFAPVVSDDGGLNEIAAEILDENAAEVKEAIGASAYESADNLKDVKRIEKYLAAAELWDRKANLVLKNRTVGGSATNLLNMTERLVADDYRDRARKIIDRLQGRQGFAITAESSGHFPQDE